MIMGLQIDNTSCSFGASITGVDLAQDLSNDLIAELRGLWVQHKVLAFPEQRMSNADLERYSSKEYSVRNLKCTKEPVIKSLKN